MICPRVILDIEKGKAKEAASLYNDLPMKFGLMIISPPGMKVNTSQKSFSVCSDLIPGYYLLFSSLFKLCNLKSADHFTQILSFIAHLMAGSRTFL